MWQPGTNPIDRVAVRRLLYVNLVAAVAFVFGGSLFALGAVFAEVGVGSLSTVNVTYLVGGFFFTLGGYVSILLASNADSDERMRWWGFLPRPARLAQRLRAVRRDAVLRRQPRGRLRPGPHAAPVQRLDLAPRHDRLRLLPGLGPPGHARGLRRARPGAGPTSSAGGWSRSTSSARSSSSSPASRPSPARPPPARSTSASSTGGRSPARSASPSAGSSRHSTHPLRQERWFNRSHDTTQ